MVDPCASYVGFERSYTPSTFMMSQGSRCLLTFAGCVVVALLTRNENFPAMMSESGCLLSPTTAAEIPLVDKIQN